MGVASRTQLLRRPVGHQPFHDRLVDEGEVPAVIAHEQTAGADEMRGHGFVHRLGHERFDGTGDMPGEFGQGDGALGFLPQAQRHFRDRLPAGFPREGDLHSGRMGTLKLENEPSLQQQAIQLGGGDFAGAFAGLLQLGFIQFRDEAQHARVFGETQQVFHVIEQRQPVVGLGVRVWVIAPAVAQELVNLRGIEAVELAVAQPGELFGALSQCLAYLLVVLEMLGAAGKDHLGVAPGGLDDGIEVLDGAVVAHAQREFIEPIEQQGDAAPLQHVAKRLEVNALLAGSGQVLGDELIERTALLQRTHLNQHRRESSPVGGKAAGEFVQEEGLAGAEFPQ